MTEDHDSDADPVLADWDRDLDLLCEAWAVWCRVHGLHWPLSAASTTLQRAGGSTRPLRMDIGERVPASSLAAFHVAFTCQPDALDKRVFELYYITRTRPIKVAAAAVNIGRAQFYRVLEDFRRRVDKAARALERRAQDGESSAAGYSLQLLSSHTFPADVK